MMMSTSRRRIAVVTGGSSGIGLATVTRLLESGYRVSFLGQSEAHMRTAQQKLSGRFGAENILAHTVDLSRPSQVRGFFEAVERAWAMPDVLICNAGISPKGPDGPTPFAQIGLEEWNAALAVNLTGVMMPCQAVLPHMMEQDFGRIVVVSSLAGRTIPKIAGAAYSASKAALGGLVRSLVATCAGHNITVNSVAPGRIATEMVGRLDSEINRAAVARIPVGRLGQPEDVAAAIHFLVSEAAGFVNGAVLDVNGGEFAPL